MNGITVIDIAASVTALAAVIGIAVTMSKLGRMAGVMETTLVNQNATISGLKKEIEKLGEIVVQIAVQKTELSGMRQDIIDLRRQVNELAHGEGFVFPLGSHFPPKTKLGG